MIGAKGDPTKPLPTSTNMIWNSIGSLAYLGSQWLTTVLVVTLSGNYANSGILAFAMTVGNVFVSIALFNVRTYQASDIDFRFSNGQYIGFRLLTICVGGCLCVVYACLTMPSWDIVLASLAYLLFKADEAFSDVSYGSQQRCGRMDYIGRSQLLRAVLVFAAFVVPLVLGMDLLVSIVGMAVAGLCVTFFYDLPHVKLFGPIKPIIDRDTAKGLVEACFFAMLAGVCMSAVVSMSRQYYGNFAGEELLGIYACLATPTVIIQAAVTYLYAPLIGPISEALKVSRGAFLKKSFSVLAIVIAVVAVAVAALSLAGPPVMVLIYGSSIEPHLLLLKWVLLATGCYSIAAYLNNVLYVARRTKTMLVCGIISLAAALAAVAFTSPLQGMNAINVAIIAASALCSLIDVVVLLLAKNLE